MCGSGLISIIIPDPDDSYLPDYIKAMAEAMEREKADLQDNRQMTCEYKEQSK